MQQAYANTLKCQYTNALFSGVLQLERNKRLKHKNLCVLQRRSKSLLDIVQLAKKKIGAETVPPSGPETEPIEHTFYATRQESAPKSGHKNAPVF